MVSTSTNFRVLGIPELVIRFEAADVLTRQAQEAAIEEAAKEVEVLAKVHAPYKTGALHDGIKASKIESKASGAQGKWRVTYNKEQYYGRMQELGSPRNAAHPFLRPASDTATLVPAWDAARHILGRA